MIPVLSALNTGSVWPSLDLSVTKKPSFCSNKIYISLRSAASLSSFPPTVSGNLTIFFCVELNHIKVAPVPTTRPASAPEMPPRRNARRLRAILPSGLSGFGSPCSCCWASAGIDTESPVLPIGELGTALPLNRMLLEVLI